MSQRDLFHCWVYDTDTRTLFLPIGGGDFSPDVSIPPPTPTQTALEEEQLGATKRSRELQEEYYGRQKELLPFYYREMGLRRDPTTGELVEDPSSDVVQSKAIKKAADARVLAALEGRLDVDPSVEADIERGEAQLKEELSRRLGPGAEGGDIWNRAISEFRRGAGALRYSVRRGEMSSAEALAQGRQQELQRRTAQSLNYANTGYGQSAALLAQTGGMAGQGALYHQRRQLTAADLAMRGGEAEAAAYSSLVGGVGQGIIGGAYLLCWIAEVFYGVDTWQTHLLRSWLNRDFARSFYGKWIVAGYRRYGRAVAAWLRSRPWAQHCLRPLFDVALHHARQDLYRWAYTEGRR